MLKSIALALVLLTAGGGLRAQPASASLDWSPCPDDKVGMQCADLQVPADWAAPAGRRITLKLGRLPATGPAEGVVLIAYGGPGGPGVALTQSMSGLWADLRKRMDVVTWDTRGYGAQFGGLSTGLPCLWTRVPLPAFPRDDADFGRLSDTNRGQAEVCRQADPVLFANMSSADHARDMEAIRKALGGAELNYYGASYAGFYGQAYARLFPRQVRTMVLDGTWNHSPADWGRELEEMARSNERFLTRFFDWCAANGCEDVTGAWRALVARADRRPVPAAKNVAYTGRDLQAFAIASARQGKTAWPGLAQAIRKARDGDASAFVPARGARYPDQATGVTECADWPRAAGRQELDATVARLRKAAPNAGAAGTMATATLACVGWPVSVTNPPTPLPKTLPPLLGAGAWGESDAVARAIGQVPGSVTIVHGGPGHTLYGTNTCARDHINRYFTDKILPPKNTAC
ncbi:alpha/beta fold hydrolase [Nonomuraea terrae]|uniref:Alpha/beta fold hydrolase n=1 Tax=Nonomuraea terrae TaxID=2530383 RepID=A0A4R4YTA6_9ACTN|nr:alpha/beta fold hydrolase [Nonomuraea terrae]TDD46832.1 alpha/beta fold hydrolase [Nonomuraea terrae]